MRRPVPHRGRRGGFTVPEMLVVVAILALMAGLAIPKLSEGMRRNKYDKLARNFVRDIRRTRALAATGRVIEMDTTTNAAPVRARVAGIRIDSPTRYAIFLDPDTDDSNYNEVDIELIDLELEDPTGAMKIQSPAPGTQIRFLRTGSTHTTNIVFMDTETQKMRSITLTAGGQTRVEVIR